MHKDITVAGGAKLRVGKTYECRHSRKGTFDIRIIRIAGEWITGEITKGEARNIARYTPNDTVGDVITIRAAHSYFIPINEKKNKKVHSKS